MIEEHPRERRLVQRLLIYWRDLAPEGVLPSAANIRPADIADMWPACFTLICGGSVPIFGHVGETHVAHLGCDLSGRQISEAGADTLLGCAVQHLDEVLLRKIPVTYGGTFVTPHGERVLYRSTLLPLSDNGEEIDGILGGANCNLPEFK